MFIVYFWYTSYKTKLNYQVLATMIALKSSPKGPKETLLPSAVLSLSIVVSDVTVQPGDPGG